LLQVLNSHQKFLNIYVKPILIEFEVYFEKVEEFYLEFVSTAFETFNLRPILKKKYRRKLGKMRRFKRKSNKFNKLDLLNVFLRKLSPLEYSHNELTSMGVYNHYFYNFFFLDIPNFAEEVFEHQEHLNFLFANSLNTDTPNTTNLSNSFFKKKFFSSNYSPVVFLPTSIKTAILIQKRIITDDVDHKYLQHFITSFISHITSFKSLFILNSNQNSFKSGSPLDYTHTIYEITSYFTKIHKKFFKNFDLPYFIEFFSFSLLKKDLNFFVKFFKKCLEEMSLKKHKKVLYSFEFMLKKFLKKFFLFTRVLGLKFEITGKISVTGNSKTRNKIIKYGYYSLTNKSLKIDYLYDVIRTTTGVLGFRIYLTY
jgi:hypothetical protein